MLIVQLFHRNKSALDVMFELMVIFFKYLLCLLLLIN